MFVTTVDLHDFRSYQQVHLDLTDGVTTFVGMNGQGKTNLVEAIEYLSTLSSHRVASDHPLVRAGTEQAIVRASVVAGRNDSRVIHLELEINAHKANRAKLNRTNLARTRELIGVLRTVVFSPEDLAIVKADPRHRRRWMDQLITLRWPRMAGVRADYDRILAQRSALLKSATHAGADLAATLDVWDEHLAVTGAELMAARLDTLVDLWPEVACAYGDIAPTKNQARYVYRSTIGDEPNTENLAEQLRTEMGRRRAEEIRRGVCLVGPHRDDIELNLADLPARGYASHGESWSYALALRLGSLELLRNDGIEPILVLDDVFAELDQTRRQRLAGRITTAEQVLITAAVAEDIPDSLTGARFRVDDAQVHREE